VPPSGSTLFGQFLSAFIFTLTGGYARTVDEVYWLLSLLATIQLSVSALGWIVSRSSWWSDLFWKMFGFAFLFWLVEFWPDLLRWLQEGFIDVGLQIGGGVLTQNDITDPGNLVDFGFSVTAILFNKLARLSFLPNAFIIILGGLSGWAVVFLYMVIACHVFMALLEYYIIGAALLILVPFLANEKTAFAGERVFATFLSHALRLLLYATILSISLPILYTYKLPNDPTLNDVGLLFAGTLLMFSMSLSAPALAMGAIHGAGALSFHQLVLGTSGFVHTSAALGAVGAAASVGAAAAARAAVSGASAMRTAAQAGQASYQAAHPFTYASRPGRVATAVVGSAQGMGTYAINRMTSGFRDAMRSGRTRARRRMP
jgi:type IV secretion system protein TrbL